MVNQDIFAQVIEDHVKLKDVMQKTEQSINSGANNLDDLFRKFKRLFQSHDDLEDDIVYPALKKHSSLTQNILKSYEAHHMVHAGILELRIIPYASESWGPKFLVVKDSILMHMNEEESIILPKARELLGAAEAEMLKNKIADFKKES